jgi:hypothetical protein
LVGISGPSYLWKPKLQWVLEKALCPLWILSFLAVDLCLPFCYR